MTSEEQDPFAKMVEALTVLENYNRALCLVAVFLGQRADQNTIQGITDIFSALLGKDAKATTAKVRGLITSLVNVGILERERVQMISSTQVSFHSISPFGNVTLLYVLIAFLIKNPISDIKWDNLMFTGYVSGDNEETLVRFLNNSAIESYKVTERFWTSLKSGREPKKIRMSKPLMFDLFKAFSGKGGIKTFKIFEELIFDYLNLNVGLSRTEITSHFDTPIGSNLNRLAPFVSEDQLGKERCYRLSSLGIFILPIMALMIKQLSIDQSIFQSMLTTKVDSDENPWIVLTRQARLFFKSLYNLP
ncbi:MAG: hypothetical protein JSV04_15510 [Candidatus Heimdallarchaeota archaeon]|nr:MAG: hypothetical protein JSV04_15510 [Candidatus Heimdallarchaeota archaeon]